MAAPVHRDLGGVLRSRNRAIVPFALFCLPRAAGFHRVLWRVGRPQLRSRPHNSAEGSGHGFEAQQGTRLSEYMLLYAAVVAPWSRA